MFTPSNAITLPALALASFIGAVAVIPDAPQPFMTIHSMEYADGHVYVDRTVEEPHRVADWRVTVVSTEEDAPSCQTVAGPELHQGWSDYDAGRTQNSFTLDVWVGDEGCADRLSDGEYLMFVTWTPRDDTPPVTAKTRMTFP